MPKEHENTDTDPKHATLAVSGVHEKLATGRCFFFTAWHLNFIQGGK